MSWEQRNEYFCKAQTDMQMIYIEAEREVRQLKAENAKLRKLCADLRFCKRNNCLTCSHGRFCDMHFDERYTELGIEVDK